MLTKLDDWGPMTILMVIAATIVLGVGGAVVILNPDTYSFKAYLDDIKVFALAIAGTSIGRGVLNGLTNAGMALNLPGVDPHERPQAEFAEDPPPTTELRVDIPDEEVHPPTPAGP